MHNTIATLGWIGSALVVFSLTQRDVWRLRQANLAAFSTPLTRSLAS